MTARFITLEGGEGAGKSTQIKWLKQAFHRAALPCAITREPGGSSGAEAIRKLLVEGEANRWHAGTEALLFMAARFDHIETFIKPQLHAGTHILSDRFYDSTYVYQGIGKHVGTQWLDGFYRYLYGNFAPDMTLYLDIPPQIGLQRAAARGNAREARFESMDITFHEQVRAGFLQRAEQDPLRIKIIDASGDENLVHRAAIDALNAAFPFVLQPAMLNA